MSAVAIGVFVGKLVSHVAYQAHVEWEMRQLVVVFGNEMNGHAERPRQARDELAKMNELRSARRREKKQIVAQLRQTCGYWTKVVRTDEYRAQP